ncbi:MAG: EAL domain-containing protein [Actinomycetota bacterium]|nr:EAL domain-containing protein [Actinomycetota bacterium]
MLGNIRWLLLVLGLVSAVVVAVAIAVGSTASPLLRSVGGCGLAWLSWRWMRRYRRSHLSPVWDAVDALALFAAAVATGHPPTVVVLFYIALGLRSLYGSGASVAACTVLYGGAYLGALAISAPSAQPVAETVTQVLGLPMLAVVIYALAFTAAKQQQGFIERERTLAAAGAELVAARDHEAVYAAGMTAARALVAGGRGVGVTLLRGEGRRVTVAGVAGEVAAGAEGPSLACGDLPHELRERLRSCRPGEVVSLEPDRFAQARRSLGLEADPTRPGALIAPIVVQGQLAGAIGVHRKARVPSEYEGRMETLAVQIALALERVDVTEDLGRREARFRSVVQNSSDVITVLDADGVITYQSPSVQRVLGYAPDELVGTALIDLVHPDDAACARPFFEETVQLPELPTSIEWRLRHRDGSWRHTETAAANMLSDPEVAGLVLNIRDVSERKGLERQLAHRAFHDALTNLANRTLFRDRVDHALVRARRARASLGVVVLDLDHFKNINDRLGHAAGDELLVVMARRLQTSLREGDTVARLGGDEFAILLEPPVDAVAASQIVARILKALRAPVRVQGSDVLVECSAGIAISGAHDDVGQLMRNADIAMYRAKDAGKGGSAVFEPTMRAALLERLELEAELRAALAGGELRLHYQPTVQLHTGRVVGVEALVRWAHPQRGLMPPAAFIPLAEEAGLIVPIGRWVLAEACRQARAWQDDLEDRPLSVAVNLSANQLQQTDVAGEVAGALAESALDPHHLVLEITESVLMQDGEDNVGRLRALKELGVRLALDDFGTGYSSLGYLKRFPLDVLKIDKIFVEAVAHGPDDVAFAHAIVSLCEILGMQTVAEGIEHPLQADRLRELGCELGQGYLFGRPLGAQDAERVLREEFAATRSPGRYRFAT